MSAGDDRGERRRFSRIPFEAEAHLERDGERWSLPVLDVSLKGVLLGGAAPAGIAAGDVVRATLDIASGAATIAMDAVIAHLEPDRIGLRWETIDLDDFGHLRRILELNLGDPALLERELAQLG